MLEQLVEKYGEEFRTLIMDALQFLDEREHKWNLPEPIDRELYIKDIMGRVDKITRLTQLQREIIHDKEMGMSIRDLAKKYKITQARVWQKLDKIEELLK